MSLSPQMSEDLLELRSSAEQLRHENTNLKSEREVAKVNSPLSHSLRDASG